MSSARAATTSCRSRTTRRRSSETRRPSSGRTRRSSPVKLHHIRAHNRNAKTDTALYFPNSAAQDPKHLRFTAISGNATVVGYQNIDFDKSGWMIDVGLQFSNIADSEGTYTIDENIFGKTAEENDQIITFDGDTWNINQYDKLPSGFGWILTPCDGGEQEEISSLKFPKGDMFYFVPANGESVTVSGQVAPLGGQTVTFDLDNPEGKWLFPFVNPYPVATRWGDINTFANENDQLITFDGDTWNINQYDKLPAGFGWILTPCDGGDQEEINDDTLVFLESGASAYYAPTETVSWTVTVQ